MFDSLLFDRASLHVASLWGWCELLHSMTAGLQEKHGSLKTWLGNLRILLPMHSVKVSYKAC